MQTNFDVDGGGSMHALTTMAAFALLRGNSVTVSWHGRDREDTGSASYLKSAMICEILEKFMCSKWFYMHLM